MQTLFFNTATKTVKLYEGTYEKSEILYQYANITTVKIQEGYYEVVMITEDTEFKEKRVPIARFPVASTNMLLYHQ